MQYLFDGQDRFLYNESVDVDFHKIEAKMETRSHVLRLTANRDMVEAR